VPIDDVLYQYFAKVHVMNATVQGQKWPSDWLNHGLYMSVSRTAQLNAFP